MVSEAKKSKKKGDLATEGSSEQEKKDLPKSVRIWDIPKEELPKESEKVWP